MVVPTARALAALYQTDETAWLDANSDLVRAGRLDEIDPETLAEYLADMAQRDRREVLNRLVQLLAHLLKWQYQPEKQTGSWSASIDTQRQELAALLEAGTLRNHASEILPKAYEKAVRLAVKETGLTQASFPEACEWSVNELLTES